MKKWYMWFGLSLIFAIGGLLNYLDGKQVIAAIIQVSVTIILAFAQLFCDKKGEKGKKVFSYISISAIALIVIWLLILIFQLLF